ncbi:MAG: glycosyltransferase [Eubacterium sp.]|nr:glycosyltransferase [Eubacterium sp.]
MVKTENTCIAIVYITDENYAMITAVSIQSLKVHRDRNKQYDVYVIVHGITPEQRDRFQSMQEDGFRVILNDQIQVDAAYASDKIHVTPVALTKFNLPGMFGNLDKIIYLDGDTIIQRDISAVFEEKLDGYYLAAVQDIGPLLTHKPSIRIKLHMEQETYFNSGVMLLNLKKLREDNVTPKLFDYKKNGINYFMDQDALNMVLGKKVKFLSMYFNFVITVFDKLDEKTILDFYGEVKQDGYYEYIKKAYILHLAGAVKPWKQYKKYFTEIFASYYNRSPYQDIPLIINKENQDRSNKLQDEEIKNELGKLREELNRQKQKVEKLEGYAGFIRKLRRVYSEGINRDRLACEMDAFQGLGITTEKRRQKVIVSLTSYKGRLYDIHYAIYSLLCQTFKPDQVVLWLGEEDYPNGDRDLPHSLYRLKKNGLSIYYRKDRGSYTKLVYALREYPDDIIVTADDDIFYPENWLKKLYGGYQKEKEQIICHRMHRVKVNQGMIAPYAEWEKELEYTQASVLNFLTGVGGVLYPPHSLYKDVLREELYEKYAPMADDIWFWAMAVLNGRKIGNMPDCNNKLRFINIVREVHLNDDASLTKQNNVNDMNTMQMNRMIKAYPRLLKICAEEGENEI